MAKNLNNVMEIYDMREVGFEKINHLLAEGKTLLMALENGHNVQQNLQKGYSEHFQAHVELHEEKENCGVCGCGKPANILVYMWR